MMAVSSTSALAGWLAGWRFASFRPMVQLQSLSPCVFHLFFFLSFPLFHTRHGGVFSEALAIVSNVVLMDAQDGICRGWAINGMR